jgi:uncharacterized protein YceK
MRYLVLIVLMTAALLTGCGGVHVKHHMGFMGPETWEATDGKVSVSSYRGTCWETEKMLQNVADKANKGIVDWPLMADPAYSKIVLGNECDAIMSAPKPEPTTFSDILDMTGSILDIFVPDPQPVCDRDSTGTVWQGRQCLKFDNGTYRWEVKP